MTEYSGAIKDQDGVFPLLQSIRPEYMTQPMTKPRASRSFNQIRGRPCRPRRPRSHSRPRRRRRHFGFRRDFASTRRQGRALSFVRSIDPSGGSTAQLERERGFCIGGKR